eukprot:184907-Chlamydomonas_euryale.AAC.11
MPSCGNRLKRPRHAPVTPKQASDHGLNGFTGCGLVTSQKAILHGLWKRTERQPCDVTDTSPPIRTCQQHECAPACCVCAFTCVHVRLQEKEKLPGSCRLGQLTAVGHKMAVELGRTLHNRYISGGELAARGGKGAWASCMTPERMSMGAVSSWWGSGPRQRRRAGCEWHRAYFPDAWTYEHGRG